MIQFAVDQLANTVVGGMADETLSARAHRQRLKGRPLAARATVHRIQAGMVQSNTVYVTYSG